MPLDNKPLPLLDFANMDYEGLKQEEMNLAFTISAVTRDERLETKETVIAYWDRLSFEEREEILNRKPCLDIIRSKPEYRCYFYNYQEIQRENVGLSLKISEMSVALGKGLDGARYWDELNYIEKSRVIDNIFTTEEQKQEFRDWDDLSQEEQAEIRENIFAASQKNDLEQSSVDQKVQSTPTKLDEAYGEFQGALTTLSHSSKNQKIKDVSDTISQLGRDLKETVEKIKLHDPERRVSLLDSALNKFAKDVAATFKAYQLNKTVLTKFQSVVMLFVKAIKKTLGLKFNSPLSDHLHAIKKTGKVSKSVKKIKEAYRAALYDPLIDPSPVDSKPKR